MTKTFASMPACSHCHLLLRCYRRQEYVAASARCSQEHPLMSFASRYPSLSSWYRYTQQHNHIFCHYVSFPLEYCFYTIITKSFALCFCIQPIFPWTDLTAELHRLPKPKPHAGGSIPFGKSGLSNEQSEASKHRVTDFHHISRNHATYTNTRLEDFNGNYDTMLWNVNVLKEFKAPNFNCIFLIQQKCAEIGSSPVLFS